MPRARPKRKWKTAVEKQVERLKKAGKRHPKTITNRTRKRYGPRARKALDSRINAEKEKIVRIFNEAVLPLAVEKAVIFGFLKPRTISVLEKEMHGKLVRVPVLDAQIPKVQRGGKSIGRTVIPGNFVMGDKVTFYYYLRQPDYAGSMTNGTRLEISVDYWGEIRSKLAHGTFSKEGRKTRFNEKLMPKETWERMDGMQRAGHKEMQRGMLQASIGYRKLIQNEGLTMRDREFAIRQLESSPEINAEAERELAERQHVERVQRRIDSPWHFSGEMLLRPPQEQTITRAVERSLERMGIDKNDFSGRSLSCLQGIARHAFKVDRHKRRRGKLPSRDYGRHHSQKLLYFIRTFGEGPAKISDSRLADIIDILREEVGNSYENIQKAK